MANMQECHQKLGAMFHTLIAVVFLLWWCIEYTWLSALYSHYKNYGKEKSSAPRHQLQDETA